MGKEFDVPQVEATPKVDKDTGVKIVGGKRDMALPGGTRVISKHNPTGEQKGVTRVNKSGR